MYKALFSIAFCTILIATSGVKAFAQTTMNAASGEAVINGQPFSYSIGEMVLINTSTQPSFIITQGFLQPTNPADQALVFETNEVLSSGIYVKVYPNPAEEVIFVELEEGHELPDDIRLIDVTGKTVISKTAMKQLSNHTISLALNSLSEGNYYLILQFKDQTKEQHIYTYKIQKIN